jgi:hypothetical protein
MTHHAQTRAYVARRLFKLLEASPDHVQKEKIATT